MKLSPKSFSRRDKIPIWISTDEKSRNTITGRFYSIVYFNNHVRNEFNCNKLLIIFFFLRFGTESKSETGL